MLGKNLAKKNAHPIFDGFKNFVKKLLVKSQNLPGENALSRNYQSFSSKIGIMFDC